MAARLWRRCRSEEAQQRVYDAQSRAREAGYPLSFYLEPDS